MVFVGLVTGRFVRTLLRLLVSFSVLAHMSQANRDKHTCNADVSEGSFCIPHLDLSEDHI